MFTSVKIWTKMDSSLSICPPTLTPMRQSDILMPFLVLGQFKAWTWTLMFFRWQNITFHKASWELQNHLFHIYCEQKRPLFCESARWEGCTPFSNEARVFGGQPWKKMKTRQLVRQDQWNAIRGWVCESSSWLEWPFVAAPSLLQKAMRR